MKPAAQRFFALNPLALLTFISERVSGIQGAEVSLLGKSLSLDEKLEAFDPARHGGEYMAAEPAGLEVMPR